MPQQLEEAIDSLDKWVNFSFPSKTGQVHKFKAGLNIRFSTSRNKWLCTYSIKSVAEEHTGFGDTPLEAVLDKIRKVDAL